MLKKNRPQIFQKVAQRPKSQQVFWLLLQEYLSTRTFKNRPICDQSYQACTIVNYDSRVVPDSKIPYIMTRVVIYHLKGFIRLATGHTGLSSFKCVHLFGKDHEEKKGQDRREFRLGRTNDIKLVSQHWWYHIYLPNERLDSETWLEELDKLTLAHPVANLINILRSKITTLESYLTGKYPILWP